LQPESGSCDEQVAYESRLLNPFVGRADGVTSRPGPVMEAGGIPKAIDDRPI